ncbi:hypothetical protein BPOR_0359g00050 [Botrytis porri]|uniref:Uncharacterized protein n=1 Tax=Botrytis porri TaxID=87229 RepID=A0A4Z1KSI7_9HELO|nr:hypothetical protein BPOR_0359g00050 [Botrytis porri]
MPCVKRKEIKYGVLVQEACVVKIKGVTSDPYTGNIEEGKKKEMDLSGHITQSMQSLMPKLSNRYDGFDGARQLIVEKN